MLQRKIFILIQIIKKDYIPKKGSLKWIRDIFESYIVKNEKEINYFSKRQKMKDVKKLKFKFLKLNNINIKIRV